MKKIKVGKYTLIIGHEFGNCPTKGLSAKHNMPKLNYNENMDKITTAQRLDRTKKKVRTKLVPVIGGGLFKKFVRVNK